MRLLPILFLSIACHGGVSKDDDTSTGKPDSDFVREDRDEDGFNEEEGDCDDLDESVFPGAPELCDGLDNDCDGTTDEEAMFLFYPDSDGDLFGDADAVVEACERPEGYIDDGSDCDDQDSARFPGNPEVCDGLDNDCDGVVDEDVELVWYPDADLDGFGDPALSEYACTAPAGYVADNTDCDDTRANASPDGVEVCDQIDNDCDGVVDDGVTTTYYGDLDGDGYGTPLLVIDGCYAPVGYSDNYADCDDGVASINPAASELCNGADDDCDGATDENATDAGSWYADTDGDNYGDANSSLSSCTQPPGYVADAADCDDGASAVNPSATELCNGIDDDCDGTADGATATDPLTWYQDSDGDGFGDNRAAVTSCTAPAGFVSDNTDCNDGAAEAWPGRAETCDGLDNDCDGTIDEDNAADALTWYADADSDGYGDAGTATTACSQPYGYEANGDDCDDGDMYVHPYAPELCDSLDNDCNGTVDESATDASDWYADADGDGYGDPYSRARACEAPAGYVAAFTDCNDGEASVYPGATEYCDGYDNDCNGSVDDGASTGATWYADFDGDGYGNSAVTVVSCTQPTGYVLSGGDCSDVDASVNGGQTEYCDGVDNDCDGNVDEGDAADAYTWYTDTDGDGYGDSASAVSSCTQPPGTVLFDNDCDDSDVSVSPVGVEYCDGLDNNCDGDVDEDSAANASTWYRDGDSDGYGDSASGTTVACDLPAGYSASSDECDDGNSNIHPTGTELCDGVDNDCDGNTDEADAANAPAWYSDSDGDGYGGSSSVRACSQPAGTTSSSTDCNDGNAAVNPAAAESCDGVDNDCDGTVDEPAATNASTWYLDSDGDGYGVSGSVTRSCSQPAGYSAASTDCNDGNAAISPSATESCDGLDNDCDGATDESGGSLWYRDADGDGYGVSSTSASSCNQPSGYVAASGDCNDGSSAVSPAATEVCDGIDNDCDGSTDEGGAGGSTWYRDADGDGYGAGSGTTACNAPTGYVATANDCADSTASINPGATDTCDGVDNNCSGYIDDGGLCPCTVHYYGGDAYMFCGAQSWHNAANYCETYGYTLLSVSDAGENTFAVDTAYRWYRGKWWTGGNDEAQEGNWRWRSGEGWGFSAWHNAEPNNLGGNEHCMQLGRFLDYTWNDEPCYQAFRFICEAN